MEDNANKFRFWRKNSPNPLTYIIIQPLANHKKKCW
jgi:hypothetical protein